jgi:hypothetical protein
LTRKYGRIRLFEQWRLKGRRLIVVPWDRRDLANQKNKKAGMEIQTGYFSPFSNRLNIRF